MRFSNNLVAAILALSGVEALSIPLLISVVRILTCLARLILSIPNINVLRTPSPRPTIPRPSGANLKSVVSLLADPTVASAAAVSSSAVRAEKMTRPLLEANLPRAVQPGTAPWLQVLPQRMEP